MEYVNEDLGFGAYHSTRIKTRNSDTFVPMSEAAGLPNTDEPLTSGGFRYTPSEGTDVGFVNHYSWNYMNTFYAEATSTFDVSEQWGLRVSGQYTDQRSVGDEIGGNFRTWVYGLKLGASYRGAGLYAAWTSTSESQRIRNPYGGYPGYISLMLRNFNRAGEDARLVGLSFTFWRVGVPQLSAIVNYARGNTPDSGSAASPDQEELDITIDYRFQTGLVRGLWIRARHAILNETGVGAQDITENRIIINYPIQIF